MGSNGDLVQVWCWKRLLCGFFATLESCEVGVLLEGVLLCWMCLSCGSEGSRDLALLVSASVRTEQRHKQCDLRGTEVWRRKLLCANLQSVCMKT